MMDDQEYQKELVEREKRQKQLDLIVEKSKNAVLKTVGNCDPSIFDHFFYGSSAIHPRHLVVWYLFKTDKEYEIANSNNLTEELDKLTRDELRKNGYPEEGLREIMVSFTTDEDIQRKTGGDYWKYFK
jgi:predicted DNA-binding transcriptional regulator YafY